ncbi:uncharacterized protein LOC124462099 [Drosophila willistoni]|uniref:uncharacterized protein LOC124462099 n=1 Tax=Drosophila willistoni TaxID=7260 RepID=UPI001F07689F|nr:uncharacterized protein LOC124462099 [Drosophila willistoni]
MSFLKNHKLCQQCLNRHHQKCQREKVCGIRGCRSKHHPLIHEMQPMPEAATSSSSYRPAMVTNVHTPEGKHTQRSRESGSTYFRVFKQLGLKGVPDPLCVKWTNDTTREENASERVTLTVANPHNGNQFYLEEVHSVDTLDLPVQSIDIRALAKEFPHLEGLPIASYTNARPSILIGTNNWNLAVPLKIKEGAWHQPIASKTRLGWALQSSTPSRATRANVSVHMCGCRDADAKLHEIIKQAFSLDATTAKPLSSPEETQALTRLESTTALKNGRYEVGLMWKDPEVLLPDSYENALKRLKCLQKQFSRQPQLKEQITKQIENLVEKGYARMLTPEEIAAPNRRSWYLPTFITKNPNKPEKVRLVWDAAAQSGGKVLNDYIWSGPDLLNSLFDLLLSFRVGRVAICGDIAEMFHQIRVRPADTHAQRFLWFDSKSERQEPNVYVMEALTFGINCAPCIAHFIRDKNADRFCQQYPQAAQAMKDYHYVDDFIYSGDNYVEVGNIATQVRDIHAAGGFHIRNWSSNSTEVLRLLKSDSLLPEAVEITATEKVLGLYWMPNSDVFTFICKFARLKRNVLDSDKTPTKRELLQVLMSMYDLLGFISCFTIELKILLQEVWRSGIGWDTDYLLQDQHEWPKCDDLGPPNNAEVRHNILFIDNSPMELKLNAEYFSDWRRLYRALARFILYIEKLKAKQKKASPPTEVSYEMIQQARTLLLRHAQLSEFNPEIRNLTRDENQLLRTRGRAENLNGQNQILLPYGHHITRLIVNWYHQEMHHTSPCINRIRGMFYIPRLRVLYKGMRKSCQRCKNESAMPVPPQMAPLPIARLAAYQRPFTYVGIDYFGPFLVAVGRRSEKRWGVFAAEIR